MTMRASGPGRTRPAGRHPRWPFLLMAHIAVVVLLLRAPWYLAEPFAWAVIAVPFSQNALISLRAAVSGWPRLIRLAAVSCGLVVSWTVACALMPWGATEAVGAGWSVAFVAQALLIWLAFFLGRATGVAGDRGGEGDNTASQWSFSLRTLLLYVTAVALAMGMLRAAFSYLSWTTQVFLWEYFLLMPVIGACNGLVAVAAYAGVVGKGSLLWRTALAWLVMTAVGLVEGLLLSWLAADAADVTLGSTLTLALCQGVILQATLWPLRREIAVGKRV